MQEPLKDSLVETLVDERYYVRSLIARGGMSSVYLATDRRLDRDVALKVLYPHLAADRGFLRRFESEAKSAARLSHPHVVGVLDQGITEDLAYLVMEYVPGRTLRGLLDERGSLSPRLALALMDAVVEGLAAAHDAGLVHRDVKPENVLLAENGRIKIADFGLARAVSTSTNTGTLVGTVAYLAPELVTGAVADERSDVYSAGIMLYEMLTGRQPYTGEVPIQVAFAHVHSTVPAPSVLCPGLAEDLDELVRWCTARDPEDRPVNGRALLGELRHIRTSLSDAELDFHCPPAGAGVGSPGDATQALPALPKMPPGATEVLSAAGATSIIDTSDLRPPASGSNHTEVIRRSDNDTTVFPAGGFSGHGPADEDDDEDDDSADYGDDDGYDDEGLSARARRRLDKRHDRDRLRESDREARRPQVSLRSGKSRRRGILLGVLIALLLAGAAFAGWFFGAGPGALVSVPDVSNVSVEEAGAQLGDAGLSYTTNEVYDEVVAAGLAVGTDPAATLEVRRFRPVTLLVSKGPQLFSVPNLVQRNLEAAQADLSESSLALGTVTEEYSENVASGNIISQDPLPDTELRQGTPVNVSVSKGPAPVEVPAVTGQSRDAAVKAIEAAGLTAAVSPEQVNSSTVPAGAVVSQTPASGLLERGSTVTLTISLGPRMVEVPNYVGRRAEDAKADLESRGFSVQVENLLGGLLGLVRDQEPGAGTAPEGSTITLKVV
ncbi:Stk1 family PASTA domain-containing Ser/Thr kinase [Arthrobacter sp. zg-Y1143]|uniref:Stk1 family PASTA domain-containing Ser/Thr kinase n=1 Tax=Arthrobacter sp. zg-Y1143 TaxID=3049065 RepID=UPI0024C26AC1|nr:Stk1 family PASTA domain-containing Ser/Thr kinase [Arthrobacter sp. zg-Y1143]MDK1327347.1 PASTA domain-containing protein [Arthrobacter sp. zg-Y1143]